MKKSVLLIALALCLPIMPKNAVADAVKAYTAELPPYTIAPDLEKPGIAHEILLMMGKRAGVDIEIIYVPWARAQKEVQDTPNTLLFAATRSKNREDLYSWITLMAEPAEVFVTRNGAKIDSYDDAKSLGTVIVLADTPREKKLRDNGITNVKPVKKLELAARILNGDRADAWYTYDQRAAAIYKQEGFDPAELVFGKVLAEPKNWLASNKSFDPEISAKLGAAMDAIRADGTYAMVVDKYTK